MTASNAAAPPRVAVVGAGAWGTTLAVMIGKVEPVLLLAHDEEAAARIDGARANERRLPGIGLPDAVVRGELQLHRGRLGDPVPAGLEGVHQAARGQLVGQDHVVRQGDQVLGMVRVAVADGR